MAHDLIKKKILYTRTTHTSYTALPVEFPIGVSQVVSLIAIHWHIEGVKSTVGLGVLIAALSENPEHELAPPVGVAEFQGNQSLYGMGTFLGYYERPAADGLGLTMYGHQVVPLYGILRPKRQVAVFANVWNATVGIRGEIYYEEEAPPQAVVDAINRRSGKFRRS